MLEDNTGCKLICPKDSIDDLKLHVTTADLALLRYGYSSIDSKDVIGPLGGSHLLPDVANKLFQCIKSNPTWSASQYCLSVRDNGCAVITHALLRVMHAEYMSTLYKQMTTMRMLPAELEAKCNLGFLLPPAGSLPKNMNVNSLSDMQQTVGQIQRIAVDSGVLCSIWALAISIDATRVEGKVGHTGHSFNDYSKDASRRGRNADTNVSTVDFEKLDGLVGKLKSSPFRMETLLEAQYITCCSLLDVFAALATPLGPRVCMAAAEKLSSVSLHTVSPSTVKTDDAISSTDPPEPMGSCGTECTPVMSETNARERANQVVMAVLLGCAKKSSQGMDKNNEHGSLRFIVGSDGVRSCSEISLNPEELSAFSLDDLKASVCDGCIALQAAITPDELQMALSWPLAATAIIDGRKQIETWEEGELKMVVELEKFTGGNTACDYSKETVVNLYDKEPTVSALLDQALSLVTAKVVAIFHLWKQLGGNRQKAVTKATEVSEEEKSEDISEVSSSESHVKIKGEYIRVIASDLTNNWAAIVFCKMRLTAMSLCRLLDMLHSSSQSIPRRLLSGKAGPEGDEETPSVLKGRCLIGQSNPNKQMNTLRRFDAGDFNLLFATDVAEEGLDLRACQLVVNFDNPDTVRSFIQRRGRARSDNSHVISLVPFGVQGASLLRDLAIFCGQEQEMLRHGHELGTGALPPSSSLCNLEEILRVGAEVAEDPPSVLVNPHRPIIANFTSAVQLSASIIAVESDTRTRADITTGSECGTPRGTSGTDLSSGLGDLTSALRLLTLVSRLVHPALYLF